MQRYGFLKGDEERKGTSLTSVVSFPFSAPVPTTPSDPSAVSASIFPTEMRIVAASTTMVGASNVSSSFSHSSVPFTCEHLPSVKESSDGEEGKKGKEITPAAVEKEAYSDSKSGVSEKMEKKEILPASERPTCAPLITKSSLSACNPLFTIASSLSSPPSHRPSPSRSREPVPHGSGGSNGIHERPTTERHGESPPPVLLLPPSFAPYHSVSCVSAGLTAATETDEGTPPGCSSGRVEQQAIQHVSIRPSWIASDDVPPSSPDMVMVVPTPATEGAVTGVSLRKDVLVESSVGASPPLTPLLEREVEAMVDGAKGTPFRPSSMSLPSSCPPPLCFTGEVGIALPHKGGPAKWVKTNRIDRPRGEQKGNDRRHEGEEAARKDALWLDGSSLTLMMVGVGGSGVGGECKREGPASNSFLPVSSFMRTMMNETSSSLEAGRVARIQNTHTPSMVVCTGHSSPMLPHVIGGYPHASSISSWNHNGMDDAVVPVSTTIDPLHTSTLTFLSRSSSHGMMNVSCGNNSKDTAAGSTGAPTIIPTSRENQKEALEKASSAFPVEPPKTTSSGESSLASAIRTTLSNGSSSSSSPSCLSLPRPTASSQLQSTRISKIKTPRCMNTIRSSSNHSPSSKVKRSKSAQECIAKDAGRPPGGTEDLSSASSSLCASASSTIGPPAPRVCNGGGAGLPHTSTRSEKKKAWGVQDTGDKRPVTTTSASSQVPRRVDATSVEAHQLAAHKAQRRREIYAWNEAIRQQTEKQGKEDGSADAV